MKATNNKKAKRGGYIKPEINCYTIETTILAGSGETVVEPVPPPGGEGGGEGGGGYWHGELD